MGQQGGGRCCAVSFGAIALGLISFSLATAAAASVKGRQVERGSEIGSGSYCDYKPQYNVVILECLSFVFLLLQQLLVSGLTSCLGSTYLGNNKSATATVVFFILSWLSFTLASFSLILGSIAAAQFVREYGSSCDTYARASAVSSGLDYVFVTPVFAILYYYFYTKSCSKSHQDSASPQLPVAMPA